MSLPSLTGQQYLTLGDAACAGADVSEAAVECAKFELTQPTLLVLGSEGPGLRPLVRDACTQFLRIAQGMSMHHHMHAQTHMCMLMLEQWGDACT